MKSSAFSLFTLVLLLVGMSGVPPLFAGTPQYERPTLRYTTKTRYPKYAGVPQLTAPPPGELPKYYSTLAFSGGTDWASGPLSGRGSGQSRQARTELSGNIDYTYDPISDQVSWTNATLSASGEVLDIPPWPADATDWPQAPVLTVNVPVSGGTPINYGVWYISASNPLRLTVISAVKAADDNLFHGGLFGGYYGVSAVEWQDYRVMDLRNEDTQDMAESRAKIYRVDNELSPPRVTSIRGTPRQGSPWTIREVSVGMRLTPECGCQEGFFERRIVLVKRPIGQTAWEDYETVTDQVRLINGVYSTEYTIPLVRDHEVRIADVTFEKLPGCGDCDSGGLGGVGSGPKPGSIKWALPLGRGPDGQSAGSLTLYAPGIDASLFSPAALRASVAAGVATVVRDGSNQVRQVLAPQAVADIVVTGALAYEIRFYDRGAAGLPDANGIHAVSGNPYVVWRVESPDGSTARVRFTRNMGAQSLVTEVDETQPGRRIFSEANGLRVTETTESTEAGDRVETVEVRDASGVVSAKTKSYYRTFAWGEERVKEIADPDGAALTTEWTYITDANLGSYRKVSSIKYPDGFLETRSYSGDATARIAGWDRPLWRYSILSTGYLMNTPDLDGDGVSDYILTTSEGQFLSRLSLNFQIEMSKPQTINGANYLLREQRRAIVPDVAWNDAGNLITYERYYADGPHQGELAYRLKPDGTLFLQRFAANTDGGMTITTEEGAADASHESVIDGTRTITVNSGRGFPQSVTTVDIASGTTVQATVVGQTDGNGRPTRIMHLDGAEEIRSYCSSCGAVDHISLRGETVDYEFDALNRKILETRRAGATVLSKTRFEYDASDRLIRTLRVNPADNTETVLNATAYDRAGRVVSTTTPTQGATTYGYTFGANNSTDTTITYADGGTRIESRGASGTLFRLAGTAVTPIEYNWASREWWGGGVGYLARVQRYFDATNFVTETSGVNFMGEVADTTYADGSVLRHYFDTLGRRIRTVDQDGVATLFAYDAQGRQNVTAIDLNANNAIDYAGGDRITRTTVDYGTRDGVAVQRTLTQVWETEGQDVPTTVSVAETSVDGLNSWQTVRGLTTATVVAYNGGGRTVTTTAPDGVRTVQSYSGDRLLGTTTSTAGGVQLSAITQHYDALGRLDSIVDVRNGATTYVYDANDRLQSVTTPDPDSARSGPGYDPQTTAYAYDSMGRIASVTQPDGGVVHTTYWPTGAVRRTWGARTYPVEYTYNVQQQVQTMTTWQDFSGDSGKAVTTWNYTPERGFLRNKRYNDNTGPSYTYTASGRLRTRTWARGVGVTYTYNAAGDLITTDYSDTTPDVSLVYDRAGRPRTITDGSGIRTLVYDPVSGQLQNEDYTAGLLNTLGVHRGFDSLSRLSSLSANSALNQMAFGYDAASRLETVTSGVNSATYGYAPNSSLVQTVTFAQGGATRLTTTKSNDNLNRLSSITNTPSASSVQSAAYDYNSANQRTKLIREDNAYWQYEYDALGQVTSGRKRLSTGAMINGMDFAWSFDDIGNRKAATVNAQISNYSANSLNQYAQRTVPGVLDVLGAAKADATVTVAVDNGQPQAVTRQGELFFKQLPVANASAPSIKISGVKNLVGAGGEDAVTEITRSVHVPQTPEIFAHDADGNLTDDARWHYTWDGENRLIAMETQATAVTAGVARQRLEFAYDGQGRRISKKTYGWNGATWVLDASFLFLYDGWNLLAELNALNSNAAVRTYAWGLDLSGSTQGAGGVGGLLFCNSSLVSSPSTFSLCYDGNGSVIAYVDMATGAKSATYEYGAFGETLIADGPVREAFPVRFSTKYHDVETGLYYYGYRYYNPTMGRWVNRDPVEEAGGLNLFNFVANEPLGKYDVLGMWATTGHDKIAADWLKGREIKNFECNCEVNVLRLIQDGARSIDGDTGSLADFLFAQASQNSYQHALRSPGQSLADAERQYNDFIEGEIRAALLNARQAKALRGKVGEPSCELLERALFLLGRATHPFEDSFSPAHRGFQEWYGPIDGLLAFNPIGSGVFALGHHLRETDDKLPVGEVSVAVERRFGRILNEILEN